MSGTVAERKRLVRVTAGNIRNSHIYITGHLDFFPKDCLGDSRKNGNGTGKNIRIRLAGLNKTIETDIARDAKTGKPRREFRARTWVREFFEYHNIQTGDVLALERTGTREYRLYPFHTAGKREYGWREMAGKPPSGDGPTVLELFAGCGGMALGFKRAGYRTLLAVEWDVSACDSLRANITDRVAQCAVEEIERFPHADVVVGGPPWQGFSKPRGKPLDSHRNQPWGDFLRCFQKDRGSSPSLHKARIDRQFFAKYWVRASHTFGGN